MSQPRSAEDLLRELESLKEDSYTFAQRTRRLLETAREALATKKACPAPTERLETKRYGPGNTIPR
jgi:hypothetical protein